MTQVTFNAVSSPYLAANTNVNGLTPESLMIYLGSRLNQLDEKIQTVFAKQERNQKVQAALNEIMTIVTEFQSSEDLSEEFVMTEETKAQIEANIEQIRAQDPQLAAEIDEQLRHGQVLNSNNCRYNTRQINATKEYLKGVTKDLESQTQLEMIGLQSDMSARQTAIQLATNLIAAMGESLKSVASNIR
jgi:vacuolar-type H+-ATPase subunit I/STV1